MSADSQQLPQDLIVVGASAGGIEALSILIGSLPANFPAPIVLAQHLDPRRPSTLPEILQRVTPLKVQVVTDALALENGNIYVVPSNRHVAIRQNHLELEGDHQGRPRPSVDLLLSTAAQVYGERLIAVILTGSGSDGASGAVEVKRAGGTVVIQNPATARYPSMPLALPPTAVDHVVDLEVMGALLYDLLSGAHASQPDDKVDNTLRQILEQINRQANIDFQAYKSSTIIRRIGRRMVVTQTRSMREYAAYLQAHPHEAGELVEAFLINVTHFFRDSEAFAHLSAEVVPTLIEQARSRDRVLRFWSAGCATGEEPYSLAMIVADLLGDELPEWSIKIFATDLDAAAITFARNGVYPANVLGGLPEGYRERFFERLEGSQGYHIIKALRQMVVFGQQDLSRSAPFPRIDLLLCRNVLIYFTLDLQDYVLNRFAFSLQPNYGYLFLGKAETVRPAMTYYELISKQWKVYRCTGNNLSLARLPVTMRLPLAVDNQPTSQKIPAMQSAIELEGGVSGPDLSNLRRLNEQILRFFPAGIVVIDRAYRLVSINATARRLLGLREVGNEQDFLHAVRGLPYSRIREAIDTVFRERHMVVLPELELDQGTERYLNLSLMVVQTEPHMPDLLAISVTDVAEQVQIRRRLEQVQHDQAKLVAELEATNKRLQAANKDLMDANEEFQVANEELMLTHEELQATVEEFETTNEELQAANEELETYNEELQATNEELETTNDELRANATELQLVTEMQETERGRLTAMVELSPFYIVTLHGPELIIDSIDKRYQRILHGRNVEGRPLDEVYDQLWANASVVLDLARATYYQNVVHISPRVRGYTVNEHGEQSEFVFVFTCIPARDATGHVQGVVLYVADETLQQAKEREEERERFKLIFERADQVASALFDAETKELVIANPRYNELVRSVHQLAGQQLIGQSWHELEVFVPAEQQQDVWHRLTIEHSDLELPEVRVTVPQQQRELIWNVKLSPSMALDQPEQVTYVLVAAIETTEQVRAREEQERLSRLKDEFLSSASHELRTPLTTLVGYIGILGRLVEQNRSQLPVEQSSQIERVIATLERQTGRLHRLVEDLIDVGRLQNGMLPLSYEPVELVELLRQIAQDAATLSEQHRLNVELPQPPVVVDGDPTRLTQVVLNLIQNAVTYAYNAPQIDLRLRTVEGDVDGELWAQIEVQDYGPGIDEHGQEVIFNRFFQGTPPHQRSWKGLGLGLFISCQIVEQHGGTLRVVSQPRHGSTFIIRLPLQRSAAAQE